MDLENFTDVLGDADEIGNSQPISLPSSPEPPFKEQPYPIRRPIDVGSNIVRPAKHTGQQGEFRSVEEIEEKYRDVFSYPFFNLVQSNVIDEALYSDKSMVVCAPTGSGKTVVFEMAIVQLLMAMDEKQYSGDFKIIYMAPVKALCTERLSEWYPKFTKLGLMCIEVTGDTDVDFSQLKPYRIIITTPEKWDMLTRRWRDHRGLVEVIKLFLIDEVHILNDETRGPVLEAVVSRMKTIESSSQAAHRIEQLQKQYHDNNQRDLRPIVEAPPRIRFVAVSATISNPEDVAEWLGSDDKPAVFYKFGDECRPVRLKRVVEGYPCPEGMSIFKFDIILNYKLWPVIQKHHNGKPTLIFCNTRKSVALTAETLSRELTINFTPEQKAKLTALASNIKTKKLQALVLSGVGCHHAGLLYEERLLIEHAFRNRDLPILITTTTLAMGVNLPAHLVIVKNTQQYVNGAYQEYSISTVLQMVGRAGRPQFDTEATAVIMTRLSDKPRYQALVQGSEPLQSYLHKRLAENLNSEAALGTVGDVAQCVQWLRSTFLSVRAAKDPRRYLGLPQNAPANLICKKIEELCVKAMNGLASSGLITMDEASCIESTEAGRLMSIFYLDLETMKHIMKIKGDESLESLLWIICECHELADMHLRVDERRTLNMLNRNNTAATIRFPMKGKINSRQMKLNCIIQAVLGCLPITDPSLNQEAMKVMRIANRVCKCLVDYVTRRDLVSNQPQQFATILNSLILAKCIEAHLWENSPYVSKQLKGIGPTFSTLLATAGKVNFTLLEESHPRDLERIINKGAPIGNVIRKQVSLLPKYQLTATPVDQNSVSVRLTLLNQYHLAENRNNLTAGHTHKCYVLVGDSENHLLLFTSFKDNDLMNVYDGVITYNVTRKHRFEHKVFVHCISSIWVGIDVQCDYEFKSLDNIFVRGEASNPITPQQVCNKKNPRKQTMITDVYKERKRKSNDCDITQSKEKKKRDFSLVEKFTNLKNAFDATSKQLKGELQQSLERSNKIMTEITEPENSSDFVIPGENIVVEQNVRSEPQQNFYNAENNLVQEKDVTFVSENDYPRMDIEDLTEDESFIVDERIDSILNEIEKEIKKDVCRLPSPYVTNKNPPIGQKTINQQIKNIEVQSTFFNENVLNTKMPYTRKRKALPPKSNFSVFDLIEKKDSRSEDHVAPKDHSGFSDTIKNQIEKFLLKTSNKTNNTNIAVKDLLKSSPPTGKTPLEHNSDVEIVNDEIVIENNGRISQDLPDVFLYDSKINNDVRVAQNNDLYQVCTADTEPLQKDDLLISNAVKDCNSQFEILHNIPEKESREVRNNDIDKQNTVENNVHISQELPDIFMCDNKIGDDVNVAQNSLYQFCTAETSNLQKYDIAITNAVKDNNKEIEVLENIPEKESCIVRITDMDKQMLSIQNKSIANTFNDNYIDLRLKDDCKQNNNWNNIENSKTIELVNLCEDGQNENQEFKESNVENVYSRRASAVKHFMPSIDITGLKNDLQYPLDSTGIQRKLMYNSIPKDVMRYSNPGNITLSSNMDGRLINNSGKELCKKEAHNIASPLIGSSINNSYSREDNNTNSASDFLPNDDQSPEILKRYSFSTTKIDVHTKHMPDREIHVIRKLKLGVDVTEIVYKNDRKETKRTEDKSTVVEERHSSTVSTPGDYVKIMAEKDTVHREKVCKEIDTLPHFITNRSYTPPPPKALSDNNSDSSDVVLTSSPTHTGCLEMIKRVDSIHLEDASLTKTDSDDCVTRCNSSFQTNTSEENKDYKIGNILQKYSKILRKDNKVLHSVDSKNINQCGNKHLPEKIKRPYKIGDIHKAEVPLPKILQGVNATRTTPDNAKIISSIKSIREEVNHIPVINPSDLANSYKEASASSMQPKELATANTTYNDGYDMEEHFDEIKSCSAPPEAEIPHMESNNFDIDQSMFNPKTLLQQCFSKDDHEDILPPPVEFGDDDPNFLNVYSPQFQDGSHNESSFNVCVDRPDSIRIEYDDDKESVFGDTVHSELTPSKEMETWVLSQDDSDNQMNHAYNAIRSCMVMRNSSPVINEIHHQVRSSYPRPKLTNFKFISKSKLKM